jgi:hypothetical protein
MAPCFSDRRRFWVPSTSRRRPPLRGFASFSG